MSVLLQNQIWFLGTLLLHGLGLSFFAWSGQWFFDLDSIDQRFPLILGTCYSVSIALLLKPAALRGANLIAGGRLLVAPLLLSIFVARLIYPHLESVDDTVSLPVCVLLGLISSLGCQRLSSSAGFRRILPGDDQPRILLVGANKRTDQVFERSEIAGVASPFIVGCLEDDKERVRGTWRHLGPVSDLDRILREQVIDEVWIHLPMRSQYQTVERAVKTCRTFGVPARFETLPFQGGEGLSHDERGRPMGAVYQTTVPRELRRLFTKRAIDLIGSLFALVLLSPLILVAMALVKLSSPGPALYKQTRIGLRGREFTLLKLRTMRRDAEGQQRRIQHLNEADGPVFKVRNDPRITWVGRLMRRTSIDELPQLINVLCGEMSLVGPRPARPREVQRYESWHHHRLAMKPGITCLWQVSGRSNLPFATWVKMDLEYTRTWTIRGDLILLLKTIPAVLSMRGAW
ncbi:MAG: sugar transferase [Planctomycetota bacterium]|nr:sugar transferase [Planctomycetota bacterium]